MLTKKNGIATKHIIQKLLYKYSDKKFMIKIIKYKFPHLILLNELKTAIENNNIQVVTKVCTIEQEAKIVNYNYSISPVHYAAELGRADIVDVLIANGYHVNSKFSRRQLMPLHLASTGAVVDTLLNRGGTIEPQSKGSYKPSPLFYAASCGNYEVVKALHDKGALTNFDNRNSALAEIAFANLTPKTGFVIQFLCHVDCNPLLSLDLGNGIPITLLLSKYSTQEIIGICGNLDGVHALFQHTLKYFLEDIDPSILGRTITRNEPLLITLLNSTLQYQKLIDYDKAIFNKFYLEYEHKNFLSLGSVSKHLCNVLLGYEFKCTITNPFFEWLPAETIRMLAVHLHQAL